MSSNNRTGLFVGKNKGHVATAPAKQAFKTRPVLKKGNNCTRNKHVREIIHEVCGFSPLEKRMVEALRTGVAAKEKKCVKQARAKLGTHRRATLKRDALSKWIQQQRRKGN